jgi:hypothetical protein
MVLAITWLLTGNYPSRKEACVLSGKDYQPLGNTLWRATWMRRTKKQMMQKLNSEGGQPVLDLSFNLRLSMNALWNAAMPLNLSKSSNQPNQRFADALLAFSLLGLIYPHHLIQATGRHHPNIRYSHGIQKNNDDYWYMPARSPAFDDLLGS